MKKIITLLIIVCFAFACDDEIEYNIPDTRVSLKLDLNFEDIDLVPSLACKTFTVPRLAGEYVGYGGLLVINGFGNDAVNLYAFDLSCPVEAAKNEDGEREIVRVVPNNDGQAVCPKCGAVYQISTGIGNPVSGTKYSLRPYQVYTLSGVKQYRVTR